MQVEDFIKRLNIAGIDFYTGVPDSQLKALCDYLMNEFGICNKHIIAANEGNCTALAAGYHLATGKIPLVYMQNSGIGNIINPLASLLNDKVYGIPCVFVVGWRGEPGIHDEPQHIFQGEVTRTLLEDMDVKTFVVGKETDGEEISKELEMAEERFKQGKSLAFIVQKGALAYDKKATYSNENQMSREEIIRHIVQKTGEDVIVSTTGKASRELFEIREQNGQGHQYDFLTVGSMGHSSSIALGIAMNKPETQVWSIDGDGAALMHMGAMAVIGSVKPHNLIHVVINNGAHETVGGMPTAVKSADLCKIAAACGYEKTYLITDFDELDKTLDKAKAVNTLTFIEIKSAIGARSDLGRPTTTARENKENLMSYLNSLN